MLSIKKLIVFAIALFALVSGTSAQETNATLEFHIQPSNSCALPLEEAICLPTIEYRVYVDNVLLVTSNSTTATVPFSITAGQEYCFEATQFNGEESKRSPEACKAWPIAPPNAPIIIDIPIVVN